MDKLIKSMTHIAKWKIFSPLRRIIARMIIYFKYTDIQKRKIIELIHKVKSETEFLSSDDEALETYTLVKNLHKIQGDIAEVGVYKGGSAKIICEARGNTNKTVHLFDTFEGLKDVSSKDKGTGLTNGQYTSDYLIVENYLKKYNLLRIYKGYFPDTGKSIENKKFCFVHLDVDTYTSTLESLKFFYPRMTCGGIIISDDYNAVGVRDAFEDFFKDKPEAFIEIFPRAMFVKTC